MNRCEVCDKFVGDNYYSDERCNRKGGYGLVLCRKCCNKVRDLNDEEFYSFFKSLEEAKKI